VVGKAVGPCFFFKHKTAYEIVDCDWSSDVCSSDLASWYETANIHLCTLRDFTDLVDQIGLRVESCITLSNGRASEIAGKPSARHNLLAQQGVFVLSR